MYLIFVLELKKLNQTPIILYLFFTIKKNQRFVTSNINREKKNFHFPITVTCLQRILSWFHVHLKQNNSRNYVVQILSETTDNFSQVHNNWSSATHTYEYALEGSVLHLT